MAEQTSLFKFLKPLCVTASEAALSFRSGKSSQQQCLSRFKDLGDALEAISKDDRRASLNAKLAEYVFFPLSHVFRQKDTVPLAALELTLRCLRVLLRTGWSKDIAPELGLQLVVLLTFISSDSEGRLKTANTTDELLIIDLQCLHSTISSLLSSHLGRKAITASKAIPALGHCIISLLDAVASSQSTDVAYEATQALQSFVDDLPREALSSFLPGIVSTLTKVLTPSASSRRSYKLLANGLKVLAKLLKRALAYDLRFEDRQGHPEKEATIPELSQAWLKATSGQLKMALANLVKLRRHDRSEVRLSLQQLCMTVLQQCNVHLPDCTSMMLDTLIMLSQSDNDVGAKSSLRILLIENGDYSQTLKTGLYSNLLALPRILSSNDTQAKEMHIGQMTTTIELLKEADIELGLTADAIADALRDSVKGSFTANEPVSGAITRSSGSSLSHNETMQLSQSSTKLSAAFPDLLVRVQGDKTNMDLIMSLVNSLASNEDSVRVIQDCLDQLQAPFPDQSLPNFWLALQLLRARTSANPEADELLNIDLIDGSEVALQDELFSAALSILSREEDDLLEQDSDWGLRSLALEVIAFQASIHGHSFRPELSDALYPILHHVGSQAPGLQTHAIITLNIIANATGYPSAQAMIVDNNDYLVNGIGLKLSTFELSPQAPRVLNMLVRLCGSKLLPYLDDLTDSIFEALECYHGYDGMVGLLFQCLGAMVEEGVQAPALLIEAPERDSHRDEPIKPAGLALLLRQRQGETLERQTRTEEQSEQTADNLPQTTPQRPWKELNGRNSGDEDDTHEEEQEGSLEASPDQEKPSSLSRPYQLIHRIAVLTQHHLPSGSSLIRSHLTHVLATAMPYLAQHEDTFLPLIHTLWPVLVPRLHDTEASVIAGTLEVMAKMAEGSGSFVRGRIADIWEDIRRIHRQARSTQDRGKPTGAQVMGTASRQNTATTAPSGLLGSFRSSESRDRSSGPLLLGSDVSSTSSTDALDLTVASTRTLDSASLPLNGRVANKREGEQYTSTTSTTLFRALTAFLLSLITHVDVAAWMFDEVLSDMLLPSLIEESGQSPRLDDKLRQAVVDALRERNADAVWLVLLRHGQLPEDARRLAERQPQYVRDTVPFSQAMPA